MILIRPVGGFGGLDGIHLALIVAIVLLLGLLLVVSYSRPIIVRNATNCTNSTNTVNTVQVNAVSSRQQVISAAERFLASYNYVNSSLSLLPYISDVSAATASFAPSSGQWLVAVPAKSFGSSQSFMFYMVVNDIDNSKVVPSIQAAAPSKLTSNYVASLGVIGLYGKPVCSTHSPTQVYWFIDPYGSGDVSSLLNMTALASKFGGRVNASVKIISTQSSNSIAGTYGFANSLALGRYVFCASKQKNFSSFVTRLNAVYTGSYVSESLLRDMANSSSLDHPSMQACLANATQAIGAQALLANYYNITQAPIAIVDCGYMALPQTADKAVCFANSTLCG